VQGWGARGWGATLFWFFGREVGWRDASQRDATFVVVMFSIGFPPGKLGSEGSGWKLHGGRMRDEVGVGWLALKFVGFRLGPVIGEFRKWLPRLDIVCRLPLSAAFEV
jgi:hypothetical protein